MDIRRVIIRRVADDLSARSKIKAFVTPTYFAEKIQLGVLKVVLHLAMKYEIVTDAMVADFVLSRNFTAEVSAKFNEEIGAIFSELPVLEDEFNYALECLSREAQQLVIIEGIKIASDALNRGEVDRAVNIIQSIPGRSNELAISSDRRISARQMSMLKHDSEQQCFETGVRTIDEITGGGRLGEFWLWAAYVGELKSTFLISVAHHLFLKGKFVMFVSLEMDHKEVQRRLICQHAFFLGHQDIRYQDVRLGFKSEEQKDKYTKIAKDFDFNDSYGEIFIFQPSIGVDILDVARELEICCSEKDTEVLIIDYVQKLSPIEKRKESREELNRTLEAAKRIALESRNRKGVFLLSGYQTSTDGRKRAAEQGFYDLGALSETINAARDANVVCWSLYTESMQLDKEVKVGIAKSRNSSTVGSRHFLPIDPSVGFVGKTPIENRSDSDQDVMELNGL